jgi:hypothetical protein
MLSERRTLEQSSDIFVGLDVSKLKIAVAVAEGGRGGEVQFSGDIGSTPAAVAGLIKKLSRSGARLRLIVPPHRRYDGLRVGRRQRW